MKRGTLAAGLMAVIMWGLAPVATGAAVGHLSPLPLLTLRMTAATLVLLPWAVPLFRRLRVRSAGRLAAAGLLGLVGYNLPVTAGLRWLPAATAGLLLATEPVWVMVLGRLFLGERGGRRAWLGSGVALTGVAVLAGPGAVTGAGGYRALAGTGLVLAGTLAFAAYTIVLRPLSQEFGAVPATAASTAVGTLPYLAFAGMLPGAGLGHLGAAVWGELAFLALGSTAAGMLLWNVAVLSGGAARVSLLLYLEPVVSVLSAAVFLGERVTAVTIGGGVLILGGVAVASGVPAGGISVRSGKSRTLSRTDSRLFDNRWRHPGPDRDGRREPLSVLRQLRPGDPRPADAVEHPAHVRVLWLPGAGFRHGAAPCPKPWPMARLRTMAWIGRSN